MKIPEISLANYAELYDYFEQHEQPQPITNLAHLALTGLWRVNASYDSGANDAIRELNADGTSFQLEMTHSSDRDQFAIGSVVQTERNLRFLRGHTHILSKPEVFSLSPVDNPLIGAIANPLINSLIKVGAVDLGAITTFRRKDIAGINMPPDDIEELYARASERLTEVRASLITNKGNNEASFIEGTRNNTNWRRVQKLKKGLVELYKYLGEDIPTAVVPIGIYYPEKISLDGRIKRDYRHPYMHFGYPLPIRFDSEEKVDSILHPKMQESLNEAISAVIFEKGNNAIIKEELLVEALQIKNSKHKMIH